MGKEEERKHHHLTFEWIQGNLRNSVLISQYTALLDLDLLFLYVFMTLLFNRAWYTFKQEVKWLILLPFGELQSSARYEFEFNILHLGILDIYNILIRLFLIKYESLKSVSEKQQLNYMFILLSRRINLDTSSFENHRVQRNCNTAPSWRLPLSFLGCFHII